MRKKPSTTPSTKYPTLRSAGLRGARQEGTRQLREVTKPPDGVSPEDEDLRESRDIKRVHRGLPGGFPQN